ncbi:DNA polymerase IV [Desulfocurvibacter africanus]|uniref:DNA polymerase IV n=1 Tax=Desulfocurvibacter africanus TaxID=873 RepID=UPI00040149BC|nr:DNA polymerase IV [Desulfocurvibacter africanus]
MRVIMHLDMDAFFASVEQVDNPELKGKPVIIGGQERGVVSAASYEARKFGVRSAMPSATARRLCPQGVFLKGRMQRYAEVSGHIMTVLRDLVPVVEQTSVDEAYVDASGTERLYGPPVVLARRLKQEIRQATQLTCSVGIAPNKFLAKIASELNKPDGLYELRPQDVQTFLRELPVEKIPGVGASCMKVLGKLNVKTAADVLRFPREFWVEKLGKWGSVLHDRAQGIDGRAVSPEHETKSSSAENTFSKDVDDSEILRRWLWRQSERVGRDLREHGWFGRTVTLKVKYADFTQLTRSRSLHVATNSTRVIHETAVSLMAEISFARKVRLIGVGVSNFDKGESQFSLIESLEPRPDKLDLTLDAIRDKFGDKILVQGRVFDLKK